MIACEEEDTCVSYEDRKLKPFTCILLLNKRYQAVFYGKDERVKTLHMYPPPHDTHTSSSTHTPDKDKKVETTHFGFAVTGEGGKRYGSTYIDNKNDTLKNAWVKKHEVNGTFQTHTHTHKHIVYV